MFLYTVHPLLNAIEALLVAYIEGQNDSIGILIEVLGHCAEPLLASGVPKDYR